MPDWNQFARNLLYGAVHRPAQFTEWWAKRFLVGPFQSLGAEIAAGVAELDAQAAEQLEPYNPPLPALTIAPPPATGGPPIGQLTGCLSYDPTNAGPAYAIVEQYRSEYPQDQFQIQWHWHGLWGCWSVWRTA
jgi:hypothetical protein